MAINKDSIRYAVIDKNMMESRPVEKPVIKLKQKRIRTVKCSICGKQFTTDKPNIKYCSLQCREAGRIQKRTQWKIKNPNYYKAIPTHKIER